MVEPRHTSLGENELDLLKMLWEHGSGTVREINAFSRRHGRRWAYTTVLTMLQRLEAKGYVSSDKGGVAHVFRPSVTRDKLLQQRLTDLADQLCEGTATPLVHALVEGQRFTREEISHFRQLLDQLEGKSTKAPGPKRGPSV
jgi:BlaI family penicillinase repressor